MEDFKFVGVAEFAQLLFDPLQAAFDGFRSQHRTVFDIFDALMEHFPDYDSEVVCNGPNGLGITKPGQKTLEFALKNTLFGADCGLRRLTENYAQIVLPLGTAATLVLLRALILARTDADPGAELSCGRKGTGIRTGVGNNLLGRSRANARDVDQPRDGLTGGLHEQGRLLGQLFDLPVDRLQMIQMLAKQQPVHRAGSASRQIRDHAGQLDARLF